MLIRTQDRTQLVNLDHITSFKANDNGELTGVVRGISYVIGIYSTEEKAIKVLDMIGTEYSKYFYTEGGPMLRVELYAPPFGFTPPKVFQMPQDDEVEV